MPEPLTYESWRVTYQSSEQAARDAFAHWARAEAELARERERGAWRPIETLPRDGRRVVVVDDTGLPWVTTADVYVTRLFAVTHWMPLPPAPERQEVGNGE